MRGIMTCGGRAVEGYEMTSDSVWFIRKWPLLSLVANTWSCFVPHSLHIYVIYTLLWGGNWESGYYLPFPWVLSFKFRHTPGRTSVIMKNLEVMLKNVSHQTGRGIDFLCLHFLLCCQLADWFLSHFQSEIKTEWGGERRKKKEGEKRKEEIGRDQVKQKSKWCWVNQQFGNIRNGINAFHY